MPSDTSLLGLNVKPKQAGQKWIVKLGRRIGLQLWIFIQYGIEIIWPVIRKNRNNFILVWQALLTINQDYTYYFSFNFPNGIQKGAFLPKVGIPLSGWYFCSVWSNLFWSKFIITFLGRYIISLDSFFFSFLVIIS